MVENYNYYYLRKKNTQISFYVNLEYILLLLFLNSTSQKNKVKILTYLVNDKHAISLSISKYLFKIKNYNDVFYKSTCVTNLSVINIFKL